MMTFYDRFHMVNDPSRVPPVDKFDGRPFKSNWKTTNNEWRCPACKRTKQDIMYFSDKTKQWQAQIVEHHDHMKDVYGIQRFDNTLICGACNTIDAAFKQYMKNKNTPVIDGFSFSPKELREVVISTKNKAGHEIRYKTAVRLYYDILQQFDKTDLISKRKVVKKQEYQKTWEWLMS